MSENKEMAGYQARLDELDQEIMDKLRIRLSVAEDLAKARQAAGLPIDDLVAERTKLEDITSNAPENMATYEKLMYNTIRELTRDYQRGHLVEDTPLVESIRNAQKRTPDVFPERAVVACQGVQGAYQQEAADRLFSMPKILYMKNFNGVFQAIDQGLCQYGVLPLENSTAGSVNSIYDLMSRYQFYIVRSVRLKINHCLLAKKGTGRENIHEIFSHEQAILQCEDYLKNFKDLKVTEVPNTAQAAEMVARSDRNDVAAIASFECGKLYGLECLEESVQDSANNYTRFICISKNLEIYPGANRTSLLMSVAHKPGALYNVLARLYTLDINMTKLESRPMPERDFVYRFYFDIDADARSDKFIRLMNQTEQLSQDLRYLGSYSEI